MRLSLFSRIAMLFLFFAAFNVSAVSAQFGCTSSNDCIIPAGSVNSGGTNATFQTTNIVQAATATVNLTQQSTRVEWEVITGPGTIASISHCGGGVTFNNLTTATTFVRVTSRPFGTACDVRTVEFRLAGGPPM